METQQSLFDILSNAKDKQMHYRILTKYLDYKLAMARNPYYASLEITPVCNLNCQMCYIRMSQSELERSEHSLLYFDDWKYYIDGLCEIGTESFTLTGGECMMHPDFLKIYEYIYDIGKDVAMITNGSCLSEEILDVFVKKPPKSIFLTLYGTSGDVYDRFCKNRNAFEMVNRNIDKLISKKIPLRLLCTIGQGNVDDEKNIRNYARSKDLPLQMGGDIMVYGKCDDEKLSKARIDIYKKRKESVEESIYSQDTNKDYYREYEFPEMENIEVHTKGIPCVAAKHVCSISWRGTMRPCVTFEPFHLDPRTDGGIKQCWNRIIDWGDNVPRIIECQTCLFRKECIPCLARHYNETHEYGKISPTHCFKIQHPEEAAKLQAEYDRRQAEKSKEESE